jgi:hypothetical protein
MVGLNVLYLGYKRAACDIFLIPLVLQVDLVRTPRHLRPTPHLAHPTHHKQCLPLLPRPGCHEAQERHSLLGSAGAH